MAQAPLMSKLELIAAAVETEPGTAESVDAGDAVDLVNELSFEFLTEKTARETPGSHGNEPGVYGVRTAQLAFKLGLSCESQTARVASVYLAACGLGGSGGGVYARDVLLPHVSGSTAKTLTMGFYRDGKRRLVYGAMGNAVFHFLSGQPVYIDFTFKGKYITGEADVALLSPTINRPTLMRFGNAALTLGSYEPRVSKLDLDLGNDVQPLEDQNASDASGIKCFYIDDFETVAAFDPEQCLVATHDFYGLWEAGTEQAAAWSALAGGAEVAFAMSEAEYLNLKDGQRRNLSVFEMGFRDNTPDLSLSLTPVGS